MEDKTPNIENSTLKELQNYYDKTLNIDKTTYKSSNDEPTPMDCVIEMVSKLPEELWNRTNLKILDPCCGNGNFSIPIFCKLRETNESIHILENILEFNDINEERLENVRNVFCGEKYNLKISNIDFISNTNNNTVLEWNSLDT